MNSVILAFRSAYFSYFRSLKRAFFLVRRTVDARSISIKFQKENNKEAKNLLIFLNIRP